MPNNEIIEGLRNALSRGYSLKQAMMSFYNAGYKKEDIEEAARILSQHPSQPLSHPEKSIPEHIKKPAKNLPTQKINKEEQETPNQKISKYEEKIKPKGKLKIILLIILLIILISGLVALFIFKDELINFFSNLV